MEELSDYPSRTLYSTWNLSFMGVEQQNPRAAHLLQFLAYLDHQDIWFELLHSGQREDQPAWFTELTGDEFMFEDAMQVLIRHCLVETHHQTGSYSLHTCVHDWTLDGLNHQIDARRYWLAFDCVASHIGADDWEHLSAIRYQRFTGHAKRLVHGRFHVAARQQSSVGSRLNSMVELAELLRQRVQYDAAEEMCLRALAGYEKALGRDHTSTLDTVNNLGNLYGAQGKLGEAEEMYLRALAGYEKALGRDHTSTLDTVNNLGILYGDQGKLGEAEEMCLRALAGYEKALGRDHTSTLDTVNNLGNLYGDQGKLGEAEEMCLRALAGYERASQSKTIPALNTIYNMALLYCDQSKVEEAKAMLQRALAGGKKILGPHHSYTRDIVNRLKELTSAQK
jgi:tetratricopeptide (TPR) repeat protein